MTIDYGGNAKIPTSAVDRVGTGQNHGGEACDLKLEIPG